MEAPIARLPPELLVLVFEELDKEEQTLCVMSCQRWHALIKGLWPTLKTPPDILLRWTADAGNQPLMKLAKKWGKFCADDYEIAMSWATEKGQIRIIKLLKSWGDRERLNINIGEVLASAASWGQLKSVDLLLDWCIDDERTEEDIDDDIRGALISAAYNGQIEVLKYLESLVYSSDYDLNLVLCWAAKGGSIKCMELLEEWGADNPNGSLIWAAEESEIEIMKRAKDQGADAFDSALAKAASYGQIECMKLLKKWGANDFEEALKERKWSKGETVIALLKEWIKERDEG